MYITLRQPTIKRIHVAAAQPGHALCGVVLGYNNTPHNTPSTELPLVGMATQDEVIHLEGICPNCKEAVKPHRCKLIVSVRWHDCGHCQGPEGHFCNGTLNCHNDGEYDHEFQNTEHWTEKMVEERRALEKR